MASTVPFTLGAAADLVDVAIQRIWIKGTEAEQRDFEQICNVETGVVDYYLKDSSISGLGYAGRILENAAITAQSPIEGYDKTFTQVQFGILLSVTKMMWFFGIKKRNLEQITQEAREACESLRSRRAFERLAEGFGTSYTAEDESGNYSITISGGNSKALFNESLPTFR